MTFTIKEGFLSIADMDKGPYGENLHMHFDHSTINVRNSLLPLMNVSLLSSLNLKR